jgi:pimeloyl-ACP methyl ester carboxylesterase
MRVRAGVTVALGVAIVVAGGCSSERFDPRAEGPLPGDDTFAWQPYDGGRIETGTLDVPADYDDPSAGRFTLFVARHFATDPDRRIGTLLVNPGGPGVGGSGLAINADSIYSDELLERFDIVGWDPRGTGLSTPAVDCIDDYDRQFNSADITPDDDAERQHLIDLATEFQTGCATRSGDILDHVGTNASAADMDAIRAALGEDSISYFGFSYGSELGATWATLFPDTVRAAVLDGAVDPSAGYLDSSLQQSLGFERALDTFLARCSAQPECVFHNGGKAEDAFDRLMLTIDQQPMEALPGRPPLTRGAALTGVGQALYDNDDWPRLAEALADAQAGDGSDLMRLFDIYFRRDPQGDHDDALEAFQAISCTDTAERLTVAEEDAAAAQFIAAAPRMSPGTTGSYFCTFFAPTSAPRAAISAAGAGVIVVVGTTGDPSTPLVGTQRMSEALEEGRLVIVDADTHTAYTSNDCARTIVDAYLLDPVGATPADGTRCD